MPRLEYFLIAESSSIDLHSTAISFFKVLNVMQVEKFPFTFPRVSAACCWISSEEEIEKHLDCQVVFRFTTPGMKEKREFSINFTCETRFQGTNYDIEGVPVKEAGDVLVEVLLNGEKQATHTLQVRQRDE